MLIMIMIVLINLLFIVLTDNIYIVFLVVIGTLCILGIVSRILKNKKINNLFLEELNIDEFIEVMEQYIKKSRLTELKVDYMINKAGALMAKGNYLGAVEFCKDLDSSKMNNTAKISYYINYFDALICAEKIEEAKQLYIENEEYFVRGLGIKSLYFEVQLASAIYYMYDGQIQKSKEILFKLKAHKYYRNYKFYRLKVDFLLAKIEISEGNNKEGKAHFNIILPQAKNTYIAKEISMELGLEEPGTNDKNNIFLLIRQI